MVGHLVRVGGTELGLVQRPGKGFALPVSSIPPAPRRIADQRVEEHRPANGEVVVAVVVGGERVNAAVFVLQRGEERRSGASAPPALCRVRLVLGYSGTRAVLSSATGKRAARFLSGQVPSETPKLRGRRGAERL